jgi:hypothetical protein
VSGKRSLDVGKQTEQMVARYLRSRGLAGVERAVRTGFTAGGRSVADAGDLTGWPGVCVQVKSLRPANAAERQTRTWLAETEQQRAQSGASVGLLVVRRWGTLAVGEWWSFLQLRDLYLMPQLDAAGWVPPSSTAPVRLELADVVTLMQTCGWAPCPATEPLEGMH